MKIVKMISANGGAEIEVTDDRVAHFERKGWKVSKAPASHKPKSAKAANATKEN